MAEVVPTLLAALAVVLFGVALLAMSSSQPLIAGLSFLSASVVIYLRETRGGAKPGG